MASQLVRQRLREQLDYLTSKGIVKSAELHHLVQRPGHQTRWIVVLTGSTADPEGMTLNDKEIHLWISGVMTGLAHEEPKAGAR